MAGTFCFYCWRKNIVLILISNRSAGSYFSQSEMLEEIFKLCMAPFCSFSAFSPCAKQPAGAAGLGSAPPAPLHSPVLGISQQHVGKWIPSLSYVRKMDPMPKVCQGSPAYTFSYESQWLRVRRAGSTCPLVLCGPLTSFLWINHLQILNLKCFGNVI